MSRRFGGKEELISVFERVQGMLEQKRASRPFLGQRRKEMGFKGLGISETGRF